MGNIQIPGSKGLISTGNLVLSENIIDSTGNIPKIIVSKTIVKVGKNTIQESSWFFLEISFSDNIELDVKKDS